jgi:predicted TIM-barrel fold metal-dependent hydrolase
MVIDTHVHMFRPIDSAGRPQIYISKPSSAEDYMQVMDSSGIDRAFFITFFPEDILADLAGKGIPVEGVRDTLDREYALEVMRRYPDRFYWFPCHLGPTVDRHIEIARENLELGAAGFKLVVSFWGELPDDPRPMEICALAREYGAQIMIDTSFWYLGKEGDGADPDTLHEGHRDVAKRVTDLNDYLRHVQVMVEAFPTVNFLLAHAGAVDFTPENVLVIGPFVRKYPNVYADLGALSTASPALDVLVREAGGDKVTFGTDWPHFAQGDDMRTLLGHVRRPGRFAEQDVRGILAENALRFVGNRKPGLR